MVKFDEQTIAEIKQVREYADKCPLALGQVQLIASGHCQPVGDFPEFVVNSHLGFRAVYSIEGQPHFHARHLSVSCGKNLLPARELVAHLMNQFGFDSELIEGKVTQLTVWNENTPHGPAINVLEPITAEGMMQ